jgi:hypothetical protein
MGMLDGMLGETTALKRTRPNTQLPTRDYRRIADTVWQHAGGRPRASHASPR